MRGNVGTRLRKLASGEVDALVLAMAGLSRLGLLDAAVTPLDPSLLMPAPVQGVLAVESLRTRGARDVQLMVLIQLIGSACTLIARRRGISALGDRPPMVSVTNADPERVRELLDEFATDVPPLIEAAAQQRVRRYATLAETQGRIAARGALAPSDGWFCEPVIAADLPADSRILTEEIFGPLVTLEAFESIEAACAAVEALPFALTAGLFSRNPDVVAAVTERIPVGNLYVNRSITGAMVARQPFGGNKLSGTGTKAGGPDYLLQFVDPHVVTENTVRHGLVVD